MKVESCALVTLRLTTINNYCRKFVEGFVCHCEYKEKHSGNEKLEKKINFTTYLIKPFIHRMHKRYTFNMDEFWFWKVSVLLKAHLLWKTVFLTDFDRQITFFLF